MCTLLGTHTMGVETWITQPGHTATGTELLGYQRWLWCVQGLRKHSSLASIPVLMLMVHKMWCGYGGTWQICTRFNILRGYGMNKYWNESRFHPDLVQTWVSGKSTQELSSICVMWLLGVSCIKTSISVRFCSLHIIIKTLLCSLYNKGNIYA